MVKKMIDALKKRYSNLGLTDEVFEKVAPMAVVGLADDAEESVIESRASEVYVSDMLKMMQSQFDRVRTEASKSKKPEVNKGDDTNPGGNDSKMDEILGLLKSQKESNEAMQKRLEALEGENKSKSFNELVAKSAKELNVPANLLGLFKSGLSPDMDEKAIKDAMGATKKALIDNGVQFAEAQRVGSKAAQTEAERKEASDWVEQHKIPQE